MAHGIFSTFADQAATFTRSGAERLRIARQEVKADDPRYMVPVTTFWLEALLAAPSKRAAKRIVVEGGTDLVSAYHSHRVHPDATVAPFGVLK